MHPRRASSIGSTNKDQFLSDETGNVRWLCFSLTGKINFSYQKDFQIDKIWSQAYSLYKDGFEYELTTDEIEENEMVNSQFIIPTFEMELIPKYFELSTKEGTLWTASDIAIEISRWNTFYKGNLWAIGKAMKFLGYKIESQYSKEVKYSKKGYFIKNLFP
jgi:predicted P-loop ATPase